MRDQVQTGTVLSRHNNEALVVTAEGEKVIITMARHRTPLRGRDRPVFSNSYSKPAMWPNKDDSIRFVVGRTRIHNHQAASMWCYSYDWNRVNTEIELELANEEERRTKPASRHGGLHPAFIPRKAPETLDEELLRLAAGVNGRNQGKVERILRFDR